MCEATVELENAFMCVEANIQTPSATNKLLHCMHPETATKSFMIFFSDVLCSVFVYFFSVKAVKTASVVQLYLLSHQFHFIQNVLGKNMQITNAS